MNKRDKQLQQMRDAKLTVAIVNMYKSAMVVMLKQDFGFGVSRLDKAIKGLEKNVEIMASGMIGLDDYITYAEELTGIQLDRGESLLEEIKEKNKC